MVKKVGATTGTPQVQIPPVTLSSGDPKQVTKSFQDICESLMRGGKTNGRKPEVSSIGLVCGETVNLAE